MRAAFIADVPDWALHRQGLGLVKYGNVDGHTWDLLHVRPFDFSLEEVEKYDLIRVGAAGLLDYLRAQRHLPEHPKLICSLASFKDESHHRVCIRQLGERIHGFMTVDHRLLPSLTPYGKPTISIQDRTDPDTFHPQTSLRPVAGPLRVGWAGSVRYWPGVKHPDLIERACNQTEGVVFVRQDRELDGQKSAEEMAQWYNQLDLYCVANIEESPTPVPWIEAAACGIPVLGTPCGELYPPYHEVLPWTRIAQPSINAISAALARAVSLQRDALKTQGLAFYHQHQHLLYWGAGEAAKFTRFAAALCEE